MASGVDCAALDVGVNCVEPSAVLSVWVGCAEIGEGDHVGEVRFFHHCFVTAQNFFGDGAVFGAEADSFSLEVFRVEDPGGLALEEVQGSGTEGFEVR